MAQTLQDWITKDVKPIQESWPLKDLAALWFHRDPPRPRFIDSGYFFSPADGIITFADRIDPGTNIDIKGSDYNISHLVGDKKLNGDFLVVSIFLTFYDVHVQRIPYSGRLSYRELHPIATLNRPMLATEKVILDEIIPYSHQGRYHKNQRMVNKIFVPDLESYYYIVQIADYDVDCITPFQIEQNCPVQQGDRFSAIRFGSQVDLIVPATIDGVELELCQQPGWHVEGGQDPLINIEDI